MTEFRAIHKRIDKLWNEHQRYDDRPDWQMYLLGKIRGLQEALRLMAEQERSNGPRT